MANDLYGDDVEQLPSVPGSLEPLKPAAPAPRPVTPLVPRTTPAPGALAPLTATVTTGSLEGALTPDQASEIASLSDRTGLPPDVVQRNLPDARQLSQRGGTDPDAFAANAPLMADWAKQHPLNAAMAADDSFPLTGMETALRVAKNLYRTAAGGLVQGTGNFFGMFRGAAEATPFLTDAIAKSLSTPSMHTPMGWDNPANRPYLKLAAVYQSRQDSLVGAGKRIEGDPYTGAGLVERNVYSALESTGAQLPIMLASILTGSEAYGLALMAAQTGGQGYKQARDAGVDPLTSLRFGALQGAVEAGTEAAPFHKLFKDLGEHQPFLKLLWGQAWRESVGEQVATFLQDANEAATLTPTKTLSQFLADRPSAAVDTFLSTLFQTGIMSGTAHTLNRIVNGVTPRATMDTIAESVKASKLGGRNVEALAEALGHTMREGSPLEGISTTYIPVATWEEHWRDNGADPMAVAKQFGVSDEAYADAVRLNAKIGIPTAEYAARIGPTDHHTALRDDITFDPDEWSARETAAYVASETPVLEAKAAAQAVQSEQLQAAGLQPDVAAGSATLTNTVMAGFAARAGMSSEQIAALYPIDVQGETTEEAPPEGATKLEQAAWHEERLGVLVQKTVTSASLEGHEVGTAALLTLPADLRAGTVDVAGSPALMEAAKRLGVEPTAKGWQRYFEQGDQTFEQAARAPKVVAATGLNAGPAHVQDGRLTVSTRVPDGKDSTQRYAPLRTDLAALREAPETLEKQAAIVSTYPQTTDREGSADARVESFVQSAIDNLRFLWNHFDPSLRERASRWYVGANRIATRLSEAYGYTHSQVSGVLAVLSPQQDWFKNVAMGERIVEHVAKLDLENPTFDDALMAHHAKGWLSSLKAAQVADRNKLLKAGVPEKTVLRILKEKRRVKKAELAHRQQAYTGVRWADLGLDGQAVFLRAYDETTMTRDYRVITPEGEHGDVARNTDKKQSASKLSWTSYGIIGNAISILRDGSVEHISNVLGGEHKVRSFFNNISDPWNPNSVTIDTHAVAAAHLSPFAQKAPEVTASMSGPASKHAGISGLNPIYAEAYFRLAEELSDELGRPVLAREVQSVTWEALRGLFPPAAKRNAGLVSRVAAAWNEVRDGKISADDARTRITEEAGGIRRPAWADAGEGSAFDEGALFGSTAVARDANLSAGRGLGGARPAGAARPNPHLRDGVVRSDAGRTFFQSGVRDVDVATQGLIDRAVGRIIPTRSAFDDLMARVSAPGGGFTYSPLDDAHRVEGLSLALHPELGVQLNAASMTAEDVARFALENAAALSEPGAHFGAWHDTDTGDVFLDVAHVVATTGEAESLGRERDQIAYYDLSKGETVAIVYPEGWQHGPTWQGTGGPGAVEGRLSDARVGSEAVHATDRPAADAGRQGESGSAPSAIVAPGEAAGVATFAQALPARGNITLGRARVNIQLLRTADKSTFFHETGHLYLQVLGDLAAHFAALPADQLTEGQRGIVADHDVVLKWLGATRGDVLTTEQHEQFARGFEAYLMEGNAPNQAMREAFARFRQWFVELYHSLDALNVTLTPEVRAVFDRLVTSDDQVAHAIDDGNMGALWATAADAGMSEEEFDRYRKSLEEETRDGRERMDTLQLAELQRERQQEWQEQRDVVERAVADETHQAPVYRALYAIRYGTNPDGTAIGQGEAVPMKLDKAMLVGEVGSDRVSRLPRPFLYTTTDGVPPRMVAEMFGYDSVDAMLTALESAPKMDAAIQTETDRRMLVAHGTLMLDPSLPEKARAAVNQDARDKRVRMELAALTRLKRQAAPHIAAGRQATRDAVTEARHQERWRAAEAAVKVAEAQKRSKATIAQLRQEASQARALTRGGAATIAAGVPPVAAVRARVAARMASLAYRQLTPAIYWSAARQAAVAARSAAARQDFAGAIVAATTELEALEMHRQSQGLRDAIEASVTFSKGLARPAAQRRAGTAGNGYLTRINGMLDQYSLAAVPQSTLNPTFDAAAWVAQLKAQGLPADLLPPVVLDTTTRTNWRDVPSGRLQEVTDGLKQILALARLENALLKAAKDQDFRTVRDGMVASIVAAGTQRPKVAEFDRATKRKLSIGRFYASSMKLAQLARIMDGGEGGGAVWDATARPLNTASDVEETRFVAEGEAMNALVEKHYGSNFALLSEKVAVPKIAQSLSREARVMVLLNWGNATSRDRMLSSRNASRQWSESQINAIIDTLDARDVAFAQDVWDHVNSFWPEISTKTERLTGLKPEKVEAVPVVTRHGTLRGGYYPLVYDKRLDPAAVKDEQKTKAHLATAASYIASTTNRGHLQARQDHVERSVKLELSSWFGHVNQVVHDLTHHETLIDVQRLLRDRQVADAIYTTHGPNVYEAMLDAVSDIATGSTPEDAGAGVLGYLRTGTTLSAMALNMWTAVQQPFGLFNGMDRIGVKWVMRGIRRWLRNPSSVLSTNEWIISKSPMMANRMNTRSQDIHDLRAHYARAGGAFDTLVRKVSGDRITQQTLLDGMLWHIQLMQSVADKPTWLGAYERYMVESNGDEARAIAMADQAVLDSQGGGAKKDQTRFQRADGWAKVWMAFYSYGATTFNETAVASSKVKKPADIVRFMGHLLLVYGLPGAATVAMAAAFGKRKPDEDDPILWFLKQTAGESLSGAMNGVVFLREFAGLLGDNARSYAGPTGARAFTLVYNLAQQVEQGEVDTGLVKAANALGGVLLHYPSTQLQKTVEGFMALEDGRTSNPAALLFGPPPKAK